MSEAPIRKATQFIKIEDVELRLKIRRNPAECVVFEIKEGVASIYTEHEIVKEIPFRKKTRRKL